MYGVISMKTVARDTIFRIKSRIQTAPNTLGIERKIVKFEMFNLKMKETEIIDSLCG